MTDDAAGGEDEEGVEVGKEGVVLEGQERNPILRVQRCSPRVKKNQRKATLRKRRCTDRSLSDLMASRTNEMLTIISFVD